MSPYFAVLNNCIGVLTEKDEQRRLDIEADIRNNGSLWPCNDQ